MKSSRNPKILNYVIKNMLDPIFHLLDKLLAREENENRYIEEVTSIENSQNEQVNTVVGEFTDRETLLIKTIATDKSLLTDMIHRNLLNPNVGYGEGEEEEIPYEETPLITDKLLSDIGYGFVKDGTSVLLAGVTSRGIALGSDTNISGEFSFFNPREGKFPSFMVNCILKLSTYFAFIGTNAGLVQYDITSGQYKVRSTSYGLNANIVKKIIPVKRKISEGIEGYLVATSKGISFSPTGDRWLNVKEDFKHNISCFHASQKIEETYTEVFIGTSKGIYFFDVDDYITHETGKLIFLEGIIQTLPSTYINALAYNSLKDTLYVATDNGITVINNVISDIRKGKIMRTWWPGW
jgi:ligand-binding sensor domain-containing protein